ncbi:hypothetical protein EPO05_01855 [Patescibacteria group bacterium]|nr:MAG: hypothetical protein EPO05_01855 [Patescibacteria group bacterium]
MYWIYLIVFTLMVFVPVFVAQDLGPLTEEAAESLLILMFGSIGFLIFLWEEQQAKRNFLRRMRAQKESHRTFRDLKDAYSYIGELNRKVDVLKETSQHISDAPDKRELYVPYLDALRLFGKAKVVELHFLDVAQRQTLQVVPNASKLAERVDLWETIKRSENFIEDDDLFLVQAPMVIENVTAVAVLKRYGASHRIEDPEMLKTLVAHALYHFMLARLCPCTGKRG